MGGSLVLVVVLLAGALLIALGWKLIDEQDPKRYAKPYRDVLDRYIH